MFTRIQEARIKLAKKILPEGYHVSKNNPKGNTRKPKEVVSNSAAIYNGSYKGPGVS